MRAVVASPSSGRSSLRAAAGAAVAVLAGVAAAASLRPPPVVPATAPPEAFSAARAAELVAVLAAEPRPPGTVEHDAARAELARRLAALGLAVETQRTVATDGSGSSTIVAARVTNLLARLAGSGDAPGAVLLVAHYDSRPSTPGAGDDASGCAVLLEVARALVSGPLPRRDVLFLLTDAEELGLLGARAFEAEHPAMDEVVAVLDFEARGNRGPSLMFETGADDLALVRLLRDSGAPAVAFSFSREAYRRMPNDTDFTVFRERGLPGLNFAFIGGVAAYHMPLDSTEALDLRSVQHHGEQALALARALGSGADPVGPGGEAIYATLPLLGLVVLPAGLSLPLAVAAVLAWGVALLRRPRGTAGGAWRGIAAALATLVLVPAVAGLARTLVAALAPRLGRAPHGHPWTASWLGLGLLLLGAAVAVGLFAWAGRGATAGAVLRGALAVWVAPALLVGWLVAGAGYLFALPLLALATAAALAPEPETRAWGWPVWTVAAVVAVVVTGAPLPMLLAGLGFGMVPVVAFVAALPLTALAGHLARLAAWRAVAAGLALAGVGLLAAGSLAWRPSERRPAADTLFYALDADAGAATWTSFHRPDEWTSGFVGGERVGLPGPLGPGERGWVGEAPVLALEPPGLEVVGEVRGGVRVRLRSARQAPVLRLRPHGDGEVGLAAVEGRPVSPTPGEPWDLVFAAPPEEGVLVDLALGAGELALAVSDQTWQLPPGTAVRPPHLVRGASWWSDSTFVYRVVEIALPAPGPEAEPAPDLAAAPAD